MKALSFVTFLLNLQKALSWTSIRHGSSCRRLAAVRALYSSSSQEDDEYKKMKEEAEKLRKEISSFEQKKIDAEQAEKRRMQLEQEEKTRLRDRYSAIVPILRPDGAVEEVRCDFPPYRKEGTHITVREASLPLGLILGESEDFVGAVVVDEVNEESNAQLADIRVGDIVRAFTACKMQMEQPAWQLIAGGIGRPKMFRYMFSADNKVFEEVMEAIGSNRFDPEQRPVLLVIEREGDGS